MSAEERRRMIARVALGEFSTGGYHGTSTERTARRAGISQPYVFRLFRLFPGRTALFPACADLCFTRLTSTFRDASEGPDGDTAPEAMGTACQTSTISSPPGCTSTPCSPWTSRHRAPAGRGRAR
ncbi:TetR/AcrR family transcriptional regulator [Streptomyces sp. NPDC093109]|uniref:TetR/AcrR family transcriptional regulator n=1 Tax=Streptomyces sp. NPDC093109 TaxID=3154977 RepID=UPI00344EAC05